jgi:hypothetical protein
MNEENFDFCKKCNFLLKNIKLIQEIRDNEEQVNFHQLLSNLTSLKDEENYFCKFCFGILSIDHCENIFTQIKTKIDKFEYNDFKLTTSFSPLFCILHQYWKIKLKQTNNLDVSLFRKSFKPIMIPQVSKFLQKKHTGISIFEVKISFDFHEDFYKLVIIYS